MKKIQDTVLKVVKRGDVQAGHHGQYQFALKRKINNRSRRLYLELFKLLGENPL